MDLRAALLSDEPLKLAPLMAGEVVVLSDGRAGHLNQSLGLAAALGIKDPEVLEIRTKKTGGFGGFLSHILPVGMGYDAKVWKDAVAGEVRAAIGTGWQVSRVMRYLKKVRPELFTIQLQRPSGKPHDYDVVAIPKHDAKGTWKKQHDNVVTTVGMLNRVNGEILAREWERWKARLASCHEPRLAVLIGGPSKHSKLEDSDFIELAESALAWARDNGGSLLVTASRRTPTGARKVIDELLGNQRVVPVHYWAPDTGSRDNPYFAFLAGCDGALVTMDSMSMLSEVATAGKPLYIWGDTGKMPPKFQAFVALLRRQHRAAPWESRLSLRMPAQGLLDTPLVAGFIRARVALKGRKSS